MSGAALGREGRVLGGMYAGYMAFILCRTAIYAASPAMVEDPALGLTKTMFGAVLGWGTAGMVAGKILSGPVADRFGGKRVFLGALTTVAAAAGAFAVARSHAAFCALNFAMLLAASAGWPAMAKLIADWYEPSRYGRVWGVISTSSRLSAALSALLLGFLLRSLSWPAVFLAASVLGLTVAALAFVLIPGGRSDAGPSTAASGAAAAPHPLDGASLAASLAQFARSGRVWLMCASLMCTTVLMEVIGFLPLYLSETLGVSPARAATASSVFPAGCLVALLAGGWAYDRVSRPARAILLGGLLALSGLCLAALMSLGRFGLGPEAAFVATAALLFVYGVAVAPSYYLPMSVFSIEHGGPRCGALIGLIDAAGYAAAMIYQFAGGALVERPGGWRNMLILLLAVSALATASTVLFARADAEARRA